MFCREFEHTSFEVVRSIVEARGWTSLRGTRKNEQERCQHLLIEKARLKLNNMIGSQVSKQEESFLFYRHVKDVTQAGIIVSIMRREI